MDFGGSILRIDIDAVCFGAIMQARDPGGFFLSEALVMLPSSGYRMGLMSFYWLS